MTKAAPKANKTKHVILNNVTKIQNAWQSGKKQVDLGGRMFRMKRIDHTIIHYDKDTNARHEWHESWIAVWPVNGQFPIGQVARTGFNSRTH